MAAKVGEAGGSLPSRPQKRTALHSSHGFPSQMPLHGWFLGDPWGWGDPSLPPGCDTSDITSDAVETAQQQGAQ